MQRGDKVIIQKDALQNTVLRRFIGSIATVHCVKKVAGYEIAEVTVKNHDRRLNILTKNLKKL